jgi:hypothetical protein
MFSWTSATSMYAFNHGFASNSLHLDGPTVMVNNRLSVAETRQLLLSLLSISASLAGFCVAGIGLLDANPKAQSYSGLGDDILGFAAVLFLNCSYLTFWALRTRMEARMFTITKVIDILFLLGLTLIVISGVGIVYAIF